MTSGTYDFYFDTADQLEALGDKFVILVRRGDSVVALSNVQDATVAGHMERGLSKLFRERFEDPSSSQEDSEGPAL